MDPEDPDSDPDHSQNWTISSFSDISWKFLKNLSISFWVIFFTKKVTNPQTNPGENIISLAEVINHIKRK